MCAICLEPLNNNNVGDGVAAGEAIFTGQCKHSFHLPCIASNVRHGSQTCPICRHHWLQLPHRSSIVISGDGEAPHLQDPAFQALNNSIAASRLTRLSISSSDDDPVIAASIAPPNLAGRLRISISGHQYLSVKLEESQPVDIVMVATTNGPNLRLLKQCLALAVLSLRSVDRLAVVTHTSTAIRASPLRRMSAAGKRSALQTVARLLCVLPEGGDDPAEALRKGEKIILQAARRNPKCVLLHVSDGPTRHHNAGGGGSSELFRAHRFHVGYAAGGLVVHEFEEFLMRMLGGAVREVRLRIAGDGEWVGIGEMRVGEERRVPVEFAGEGFRRVSVRYSYVDGGEEVAGEIFVEDDDGGEEGEGSGEMEEGAGHRRRSGGGMERWGEYGAVDPFMARRWAKHLHGCRA